MTVKVYDSKFCKVCGLITAYGPRTIYESKFGCKCKEGGRMKITVEVPLSREQINDALGRLIELVTDHTPDAAQGNLRVRYDNVVFLLNSMTGYQLADEERGEWLKDKGG